MIIKSIAVILAGYVLGCISTGYYLTRHLIGEDIREHNSGSTGARNVSRSLGWKGFVLTSVGDLLKGVAAVLPAKILELPDVVAMITVIVVVAGHIWPVQLKFRGGKGAVTTLGALLVYSPGVVLWSLLVFAVLYTVSRRYMASGILAICSLPVVGVLSGFSVIQLVGFLVLVGIILIAHRQNICKLIWKDTKAEQTGFFVDRKGP